MQITVPCEWCGELFQIQYTPEQHDKYYLCKPECEDEYQEFYNEEIDNAVQR